jgi:hypothetical protein
VDRPTLRSKGLSNSQRRCLGASEVDKPPRRAGHPDQQVRLGGEITLRLDYGPPAHGAGWTEPQPPHVCSEPPQRIRGQM